MEQELTEGRQVWLKLPYGDFTVRGDRDTVLIAGGTGITAFAAFLTALTAEFPHQLTLLYGARNPELLLYPEVIEHCRQALPRFKVYYFAEQGAAGELIPGRLSLESVRDESAGADFYLSGPPAMIRALSEDLRGRGVAAERIKVDAWE